MSFFCWAIFLLAKYAVSEPIFLVVHYIFPGFNVLYFWFKSAEGEVVKYNAVEELTKLLDRLNKTHADVKDIRVRKNEAKEAIMAQIETEMEVELSKHPTIIDARVRFYTNRHAYIFVR